MMQKHMIHLHTDRMTVGALMELCKRLKLIHSYRLRYGGLAHITTSHLQPMRPLTGSETKLYCLGLLHAALRYDPEALNEALEDGKE